VRWEERSPYRGRRRVVIIVLLVVIAGLTAIPATFVVTYGLRGHTVTTAVVQAEPGLCRDNKSSVTCWKGLVDLDGRRTTVQGGPWIPFQADPNRRLIGRPVTVRVSPGHTPTTRTQLAWSAVFALAGLVAFGFTALRGRTWLTGRSPAA
jgi:hypothetical protein